jgi:hypothetical protein
MWTDVFASPGWRTTGTQAQTLLIAPLGWRPDLREKLIDEFNLPKGTQRIDAPTPYVWIIGRIKTDGPSDYDAVHKLQAALKITPLSRWGKTLQPVTFKPDPTVDMETRRSCKWIACQRATSLPRTGRHQQNILTRFLMLRRCNYRNCPRPWPKRIWTSSPLYLPMSEASLESWRCPLLR